MRKFRVMSDTGFILTVTADKYNIKKDRFYDQIEFYTADVFEDSGFSLTCSLTFTAEYYITELRDMPRFR